MYKKIPILGSILTTTLLKFWLHNSNLHVSVRISHLFLMKLIIDKRDTRTYFAHINIFNLKLSY